jgi:hypothetical protein
MERLRAMSWIGACAACMIASDAGSTTFHGPVPSLFDLKPAESILFQQLACTDRYGVRLEKAEGSDEIGTEQLAYSKRVLVRCHPHRSIEGQPVKYLVECQRADLTSAWECDPGRESMLARVGGILVNITIDDASTAKLDQAFVIVKYLRSSGQLDHRMVDEPQVPGEEGFASCRTFSRYGDGVEMVRCPSMVDVPLTRAAELQP